MTRRPRWLPLLMSILAFSVFAALGNWQYQRAGEREAELAAIAAAEHQPPLPLPPAAAFEAVAWRFVQLEGRFLGERQFLLDNRTLDGEPGFGVLTPFALADGRVILVDRGWVPAEGRAPAQSIHLPAAAEDVGTVVGRLWRPEAGLAIGPALAPGGDWPRTTTRVDYAALGDALGRSLEPGVVRIEEPAPWTLRPRAVQPRFGPERHLGYAFQWYALAATVLVVTGVLLLRSRRQHRMEHE